MAKDASRQRHPAQWVAYDPESGLTLLRIAPRAVRPIQIATDEATLGSQVVVVGNPFGLGHSVSRGHIAGLDRALKLGSRQLGGLIQIQAPLYPGDSGAVVANLRGQLLGLIRSGLAIPAVAGERAERDNDFGFAIPVRDVLWVADQLRARGRVDRAYLGVRLGPVTTTTGTAPAPRQQRRSDGVTQPTSNPEAAVILDGAFLQEVLAGTPAALAGLQAGDIITAIDGQPVHSPHDLTDRLDRLPAKTTIRLDVVRGRGPQPQRLTLVMQTTSRPEAEQQASLSPTPSQSRQEPPVSAQPAQSIPAAASPATPSSPAPSPTVVPTAAPATASTSPATPPPSSPPISPGATAVSGPDPRTDQGNTQARIDVRGPAPISIPAPVRSPLQAPVQQPQAEELKLTLPRAVTDRLEHLERRLETLERKTSSLPETRQASSTRTP